MVPGKGLGLFFVSTTCGIIKMVGVILLKKIITLVFALIIFCGTCPAFETPNPEQWTFL